MIKIQFDHQVFSMQKYGGISRYFANLQNHLATNPNFSFSTGILYSNNYYIKNANPILQAIGSLLFRKYKSIFKWNSRYSLSCIRKNDFDIFHPTYYDPYFLTDLKRPFVLTVHDMIHELFPENFDPADVYTAYKRRCIEKADHLIAISQTTKRDLQHFFNIPDHKITVVYHGIDLSTPELATLPPTIPQHFILYVGERKGYKNFDVLAQAFKMLAATDTELHLVLAGGGALTAAETLFFNQHNLQNRVLQISASDEQLNSLYQQAKCFVFTSRYEGFGLPVLEAFKNHCPLILADNKCFREIAGADTALFFNPDDEQELVRAITQITTDSVLTKGLTENGYKRLQDFSLQNCIEQTLQVYQQLTYAQKNG